MVDMPLMAATAWAQAHAAESKDPVAFGAKVAQVYLAAEAIKYHGCKDTFSELEATILRDAGFGEPTPPKNGGDANAEGAAQPHKPTPPSPCGGVAALYEAMQQAAVAAPVVLLERSLRVRLTPATLSELDESGPPRTVSLRPVNLADPATAVAPAFGLSAVPGRSMRPADSDALPTTLSSQVPSPPVVIL